MLFLHFRDVTVHFPCLPLTKIDPSKCNSLHFNKSPFLNQYLGLTRYSLVEFQYNYYIVLSCIFISTRNLLRF